MKSKQHLQQWVDAEYERGKKVEQDAIESQQRWAGRSAIFTMVTEHVVYALCLALLIIVFLV